MYFLSTINLPYVITIIFNCFCVVSSPIDFLQCFEEAQSLTANCVIDGKTCLAFDGGKCKEELNHMEPAAAVTFADNSSITIIDETNQVCVTGFNQSNKKEKIYSLMGIYLEIYIMKHRYELNFNNGEFMFREEQRLHKFNSAEMLSSLTACLTVENLNKTRTDPEAWMYLNMIPLPLSLDKLPIDYPKTYLNTLNLSHWILIGNEIHLDITSPPKPITSPPPTPTTTTPPPPPTTTTTTDCHEKQSEASNWQGKLIIIILTPDAIIIILLVIIIKRHRNPSGRENPDGGRGSGDETGSNAHVEIDVNSLYDPAENETGSNADGGHDVVSLYDPAENETGSNADVGVDVNSRMVATKAENNQGVNSVTNIPLQTMHEIYSHVENQSLSTSSERDPRTNESTL